MKSDWPLVTIDSIKADSKGSIAIGPFGSRMKSDCYVERGISVIRGTNITGGATFKGNFVYISEEKANTLGASNVYQNDLVFPHRGSIGEVGIILDDERYIISSSLMKLTCDREKVNPKFLYYFFKSRTGRHELLKNASQVGTPGIGQPLASLKSIEFRLPPLLIQNQIEGMLTSIDNKIELNRQTNRTLEHIAQAIFKSWFVDFEPTRAKIKAKKHWQAAQQSIKASSPSDYAEPSDKQHQHTTSLQEAMNRAAMAAISGKTEAELNNLPADTLQQLRTTAELFPDTLVESELGEIPAGWEVKTFGEVAQCYDSKRIPLSKKDRREKKPGNIPYYGATSIMDYVNEWIFDDIYLLLGEDGSVIHEDGTPFIQYIWGKAWVNNHAHVLQGKNGVSTEQLMLFMQSQNIAAYITGAVQLKLNQGNMNSIPFLDAGKELNIVFYGYIKPLYEKLRKSIEEIQELMDLRDTLLPKLLSGELSATV